MNLNLIPKNSNLPTSEAVTKMSQSLNLHPVLAELLISRGLADEQSILKYLHANKENFYDPFLMKGMELAVKRIRQAINNDEKIVVYGDYDADGICASAILSLYLSSQGLGVYTHIPNRVGDGYGLNVESIEKIIEACCPDLIITCDCGISGHAEVEYAMDLGVDVIVTDHHEVSDLIPQCIVINPKQNDCQYPYNYLCGAGVALKLVHALGGLETAMQYLDLAAVATIADLVPLLDENRLIVQLGLSDLTSIKNMGLKALLEDQQISGKITSGDIAYKIAPRINASGRMGDAYRAFELLTVSDAKKINEIILQMNEDNTKRKELCDALYEEAVVDLQYEDLINNRAIILGNPQWEKGITGILAARLAGDYKRPAFIMVNSGEQYKGTSRSISGINIYELLSSVSDLLIEFGGHSQAAGFSIKESNISAFKVRVNEYLKSFPEQLFEPNLEYDLSIPMNEMTLTLARELEKIEPSGNGNSKPLFKTTVTQLQVTPCKNNINHTNISINKDFQILAFNFYAQNQFLMGEAEKDLILELQINHFANKESIKGVLRGVKPSTLYINDEVAKGSYLKTLAYMPSANFQAETYDKTELRDLIGNDLYGTLVICGSAATYQVLEQLSLNNQFLREFLYPTVKNNFSRIMISPEISENILLSNYQKIIFADSAPGNAFPAFLQKKTKAKIYIPKENNEAQFYNQLKMSRADLGGYFEVLKKHQNVRANNVITFFKQLSARVSGLDFSQFIAAIMVFSELKIITVSKGQFSVTLNQDVRKELTESKIYNYLSAQLSK